MLQAHEEKLLSMSFEQILTYMMTMPHKFLVRSQDKDKQMIRDEIDKSIKDIKLGAMLLERLDLEFEESFRIASRGKKS